MMTMNCDEAKLSSVKKFDEVHWFWDTQHKSVWNAIGLMLAIAAYL